MSGRMSQAVNEAVMLWKAGATLHAATKATGCSISGLCRALRRAGEPHRAPGRRVTVAECASQPHQLPPEAMK